ncbi:hypothetical protein, partial [Kocuria salsicia]|uniref:hypothetical protein n=1 Tax=Kocuria salsicia TaxID=664639 RepID=UPI001643F00F
GDLLNGDGEEVWMGVMGGRELEWRGESLGEVLGRVGERRMKMWGDCAVVGLEGGWEVVEGVGMSGVRWRGGMRIVVGGEVVGVDGEGVVLGGLMGMGWEGERAWGEEGAG